jgi:hypothetical protein
MQFDVIVWRICASNILKYFKKEISQDSLAQSIFYYSHFEFSLYREFNHKSDETTCKSSGHVLNCEAYGKDGVI